VTLLHLNPAPNVDHIADRMAYLGRFARSMPPSWDGAGIAHIVCDADGHYVGKMLPGRGLYLAIDPKYVGITRGPRLPHVFTPTPVQRLAESARRSIGSLHAERLAIAAFALLAGFPVMGVYDDILNARIRQGKANDIAITKVSVTTTANQYATLARLAGQPGTMTWLTTTPPTDQVADRATAGAWSVGLANPVAPDKKAFLTWGYAAAQQINMGILHDLLTFGGTFRLTVNTEEIITTPTAVNRQYQSLLGAGNLITMAVIVANSTTSHTFQIKYTNQAGTANQTFTTSAITIASLAEGLYPVNYGPFIPFAAGDYGIQLLKSTTSSVALAAGQLESNIYFPLAFVPGIAANAYIERDSTIQVDGALELVVTAGGVLGCLGMYVLPNAASSGIQTHFIRSAAL